MRRYYQILGISPTATAEEIKQAWLFSLKAFHPDKFAGSSSEQRVTSEARTRAINEAYRILSDPVSRSVYDRDYFRETAQQNVPRRPADSSPSPPPPAGSKKAEHLQRPQGAVVSFIRRRPLATTAIFAGVIILVIVTFVAPQRRSTPKEPPFTQLIIPSAVPTPMIVVPSAPENTPIPSQPVVFDLPKLAAVARKAVGLVLSFDAKGKVITTGSGFFISEDGRFVTNEHVIHGAKRSAVKTENGALYSVKEVLADSSRFDLAILQVQAKEMPYLKVETAGIPEVGSRVAVIGSPVALEGTVSDGIVSAIRTEKNGTWIQITAPLSPGSSGSPVLNAEGHVIGIATLASTGRIQNLNFARSAFDLLVLSQSIGNPESTTAGGLTSLRERFQSPAPSPSSPPTLTLASPSPTATLSDPPSVPDSPTPDETPAPPSAVSPILYRVVGLPRSTPFLNIRAGPGAHFAVVAVFTPKGRGIKPGPGRVTNGKTVWQEVFSGDFHGWVNAQYLELETSAEKSPAPQPTGGHN